MVRKLSQEKRAKLLSAALKLFVAQGVQNTSTAEIAKEAGMAAGTLFLYFPRKQDLLNELVLEISKGQANAVKSQFDPSLSARDTFFKIWNSSIRWFLENMDAYQYVQQVRDTGVIEEQIVQETYTLFQYYFVAIQKGLEEGCIKHYPPEIIGGFLYQDIVAVMNLIRTQIEPDKQEEVIQIGFDIFWDGIKTSSLENCNEI